VRIHGLRAADLADAPPIEAVLDGVLEALAGRTLVAHAAWVEEGFLRSALARAGVTFRGPVVDTVALGAPVLQARGDPAGDELPLTALAERLGLPVHRPHHADGDALTAAQVFLALATHMESAGRGTLGDLTRPDRRRRGRLMRRR
jgi:DNA polymerase III subunit epsilon